MRYILLILLLSVMVEATPIFFVPKNPKPNAALFIVLHGCLSSAQDSVETTRMSELGEKLGFYIYYPEPYLGEETSKGCFEFYTPESQKVGGGDAGKVMENVNNLLTKYDIDPKKIFVMGMSGGASLVSVLISCYPNQIQGAAIHSGMGYGLAPNWQQSLLVAQTGPIYVKPRNNVCNIKDYKGKLMLIQGSRDMIMNPTHYTALQNDFLSDAEKITEYIPAKKGYFGYFHQKFYDHNALIGQGLFIIGMNHEWSGYKSHNPVGPLGPDASKMIVEYFLDTSI
jgi:poly(hydroxyalkanoate) depolymerase family esterase